MGQEKLSPVFTGFLQKERKNEMKKTIVIALTLCLCLGLCACGEDAPSVGPGPIPVDPVVLPEESAPAQGTGEPIALTTGNWSEYLDIEVGLVDLRLEEKTEEFGKVYVYAYMDMDVRAISKSDAYTFQNVEVKVRITTDHNGWLYRAFDVKLALDETGYASESASFASDRASDADYFVGAQPNFNVEKISGTVTVNP